MRTILVLCLVAGALAAQCGRGGLTCTGNQCHYPAYLEGCLTYSPDNQCQECHFNYGLSNGRCFYAPNSGSDCCLSFDGNSRCTQCAGGLLPNQSSGLCQDVKITGCIQQGDSGCQVCSKAYDLIQGTCIPAIPNCISYNSQANCIACSDSTQLQLGACVPLIPNSIIPHCQTQTEYGCGRCEQGYRITSQGQCEAATRGCIIHNFDGSCKQCFAPFFELANGACSVVGCTSYTGGVCQSCDGNVGFQLQNGKCVISQCVYFTQQGCSVCAGGLVAEETGCRQPQGKVCMICRLDEYLGADGQCHTKDVLCTIYSGGVCTKCCDSYFLDANNQCKQIQVGCVYQNRQCVSCNAPFIFSNGQCLISGCVKYCNQGCVTCDSRLTLSGYTCGLPHCQQISSNYECQQCSSGYEFNQAKQCVVVDPNCLKRNSMNVCLSCKTGFRLDVSGFCSTQKFGCNYVDGRCTSCRAPFDYVPATESCEIDGCLSYFVGGCQSCKSDYSLLYNTCKLPNCLISRNSKCIECDPDFVFRSDGVCVSKDEFCEKMDQYGTCIKCMSSYYYSQKLLKCVKKAPGCQYDQNDFCYQCSAPFTFDAGRCIIKGCLRSNDAGCYQCKYPFTLTQDKLCAIAHCKSYDSNGKCSSCDIGYALSSKNLCEIEDSNCKSYNSARTSCIECIKGYRVDVNGRCSYADEYCSFFDETGICVNCDRLYFLNFYGKCQLRDPQCVTYTNGMCSQCRPYYFPKAGICMGYMSGCAKQFAYGQCTECERDYKLKRGNCVAKITKLSWNSIDMDFFGGGDAATQKVAKQVFSFNVTSTLNLVPALAQGTVFFSSSSLNNPSYQLSGSGSNGWSPSGSCIDQYLGVQTSLQTFYAIDIKQLSGSALSSFSIEYSMDGKRFIAVQDFTFDSIVIGSVTTFYFKAVEAKYIRLVVREGTPNIRVEFYYSKASTMGQVVKPDTFIGKTVAASVNGIENGGVSNCSSSNGLCWAGVESCQPKEMKGFSLIYQSQSTGSVSEITIEYSTDGVNFVCYQDCKPIALTGDGLVFPSPLLSEKVHVHFVTYTGHPSFGIKFDFL